MPSRVIRILLFRDQAEPGHNRRTRQPDRRYHQPNHWALPCGIVARAGVAASVALLRASLAMASITSRSDRLVTTKRKRNNDTANREATNQRLWRRRPPLG
jgi:hypothetical protein